VPKIHFGIRARMPSSLRSATGGAEETA